MDEDQKRWEKNAKADPRTSEELVQALLRCKSYKDHHEFLSVILPRGGKKEFALGAELLKAKEAKKVIIGARILGELGYFKKPFELERRVLLEEALKQEKRVSVINGIIFALGHLGAEPSLSVLISYLNHTSTWVRYPLAHALGAINHPLAVEGLLKLAKDEDQDVRDWATFGLHLGIEDTPNPVLPEARLKVFKDGLKDPFFEVVFESISGLIAMKDPYGFQFLVDKLKEPDVFSGYFDIAGYLGDRRFLPYLEVHLKDSKGAGRVWLRALKRAISDCTRLPPLYES